MGVQRFPVRVRIFIEGVEVTKRYSSVSGLRYSLNQPGSASIVLENPEDDFLITEQDLDIINKRKLGQKEFLDFSRLYDPDTDLYKFKNAFISRTALETVKLPNGEDDFLYYFGLNDITIPYMSQVRIFADFNGVWYYLFTGLVNGRSFTQGIEDEKRITLNCYDVLHFLSTSKLANSLRVYDPKLFTEYFNGVKEGFGENEPVESSFASGGLWRIPDVRFSITKFALGRRGFIEGLAYSMFGDTLDPALAALVPEEAYSAVEESKAVRLLSYSIGYNGSGVKPKTIVRNREAAGLFNLENVQIGIFGENASGFYSEMSGRYSDWGLFIVEDWKQWERITWNVVEPEDLYDLAVDRRAVELGIPDVSNKKQSEVVDIIGKNTRTGYMFDASGGSLKILLPGAMSKSGYDVLNPIIFEKPRFRAEFVSRFQMFAHVATRLTDFVFYATPKGHIVVEVPLYDVDYFGEERLEDITGTRNITDDVVYENGCRSFSKNDLRGSYSDNINEEALASVSRSTYYKGAMTTEVSGAQTRIPIDTQVQCIVSPSLMQKFGVKSVDNDASFGWIPPDKDGALARAEVLMALANRRAFAGTVPVKFIPRNMLNRQIEIRHIGRTGLVQSQNATITQDSAMSTSLTLAFMRCWGGRYRENNPDKRAYDVAIGEQLLSLGIDYRRFFNQ